MTTTLDAGEVAHFYETWPATMGKLRATAPELSKAYGTMSAALMGDGALSRREKELVALGIGLALRCHPCILAHVNACLKAGATREQVMDVAAVNVAMQGGPGLVHVPMVIEALEKLQPAPAASA